MYMFNFYMLALRSSQGLNSTHGWGLVYIIHVYNFLLSPFTQFDGKPVCYLYLLI